MRLPCFLSLQFPPFKCLTDWMCFLLIRALFMFEPSNPSPIELDFVRLVSVPIMIGWDFIRLAVVPILTWWVRDSMGMSESVLLRTPIPCRRAGGNEQRPMWRDVELRRPQVWQSLLSGACPVVLPFYTINWHHILLCKIHRCMSSGGDHFVLLIISFETCG
jgi:hypothetical protein